jgi:DnaJ family protein A protein 2
MEDDFYFLLKVSRTANEDEIKKAYFKLAQLYHPDVNHEPGAQTIFLKVKEAYEILSDPQKRDLYDRFGRAGLDGNRFEGVFQESFGNGFFESLFSGVSQKPLNDIVIPISVTLEDIHFGRTKQVSCNRTILCVTCRGLGTLDPRDMFYCQYCKGSGKRIIRKTLPRGIIQQFTATCSVCSGKGQFIKNKCGICHGRKIVDHEETINILCKGVRDGDNVVFKGKGDEFPGMKASDLIFQIKVEKHPNFEVAGDDLVIYKTVSLVDALTGCSFEIVGLDGKSIKIDIKDVVHPGQQQTILKKGLNDFGNLIVKFNIEFPRKLKEDQKQQLKEILK